MDELPVKHQKITLSYKTVDFYLKLLLLLENVKHNQSLIQHYPLTSEVNMFPNFTSEAGSPFFFKLPIPATPGHVQHYQLSLADGDSPLPRWMVFRRQTSSLAGLALSEDCGIYHLKLSVVGEQRAADFYLHILNRTVTVKDSAWDTLSCSEGEITIWASLLLQLNPATLDASQRIRLVSIMADYLRLPLGFVCLFSRRKPFIQQEKKLRVCSQGGLAEKTARGNEKQDASADVAQLLWRVGCQGEEQQSDLVKILEYSVAAGVLARLLEAPVLGWRVLCASGVVQHKVKRDLHRPYSKDVSDPLERHVSTGKMILTTLHTFISVEFGYSHSNWFSFHSSQEYINQAGLSASKIKPPVGATGCSELVPECFRTTELFHTPFLPEQQIIISTVKAFVREPSAPSSTLHSIYTALPLTPDSYSVTSVLTHEVVDRKSLATCLTLRPQPKETPLWTGAFTDSHTDSESPPTLSSQGHFICNQGPIKDHHTAKPTLHNLPSVSHPPLAENYNHILLLSSRLKSRQSLPPSNNIPSTQLFPDVSPTSCLMTEQFTITQRSGTIRHLSSVLNQDVMSQLNVTTQDASSTTLTGELTESGQTGLEPSLSASLLEPSVMTLTPALPSELGLFTGQLETPSITNPVFTVESPSMMPPSQTFSKSLPPDIGVVSLQKNLESPLVADLQSNSGTELCFDQNAQMQTLSSDILLMSLQPTYPCQALQTSLPLTKTHHIISVPFKEQPSVKSAHESLQFMTSMQQTLNTLQLRESQQVCKFSHISFTGMTTSIDLNAAALTSFVPDPSVTHPAPFSVSEGHFDPTAPSAVREPYITAFIHQIHNLDPSFPSCGQSAAQDHVCVNSCTPKVKSTYLESTVEHMLDVLTRYSQDEKYWAAFQSQFLTFDSSGQFFLTQTSNPAMHLSASMTTEINQAAATPQMDSLSLEDSGFSVITHTPLAPMSSVFSGNCVSIENSLLICQTDTSGPITKGRPTQQILSTYLSPFYGMLTTLLTSVQAAGLSSCRSQSSVQPTSSASISSPVNLPPKVLQSIPVLTATVGFPFRYSIPPKTFLDPEDGEADALSLEIRLIDGPPVSVGTWLALDGLELHGVPLEVDLQFAPQHLLLSARDSQGLSSWLPLTLDLRRSPVDPCHVFTLTAQRSLHSILRHRHRLELLLRKLSRFFNSSSTHHLSVVSMRPGSTVVSWYNYSLCGMDRNGQCHADQIQSMWLAMRSADGSVNPTFRKSMLPEFPITKVGPLSYRQNCFSTASPPIFVPSTPAGHNTLTPSIGTNTSLSPTSNTCAPASPAITATSQQMNHYQWMAGMFTALLVVCLLILIVLLVAAVLHFCKGRRRSRTAAIWPASRVLSVQSRDLRAIRPRRPPLFQPELPPPPLRLWIGFSQGDEGPSAHEQGRKTLDKALQPRSPQYDLKHLTSRKAEFK